MANTTTAAERQEATRRLRANIGIIVTDPIDCAAALELLDEQEILPPTPDDPNFYYVGTFGVPASGVARPYRVVLVQCSNLSASAPAMVAKDLIRTFSVKHVILLGVAAAIPHPSKTGRHMRLGDVVVAAAPGPVCYDFAKPDWKLRRSALPVASPPSRLLLAAVDQLRVKQLQGVRPWESYIAQLQDFAARPADDSDLLLLPSTSSRRPWRRAQHPSRPAGTAVVLHTGLIGTADCMLPDVRLLDTVARLNEIIAIEEHGTSLAAAGWDQAEVVDYLIVRGIHVHAGRPAAGDAWRRFAALSAATCVKALLDLRPIPVSASDELTPSDDPNIQQPLNANAFLDSYCDWVKRCHADLVIRDGDSAFAIPISDAYVSIDLNTAQSVPSGAPDLTDGAIGLRALWDTEASRGTDDDSAPASALAAELVLSGQPTVLVLGEAGSGKSTLMQYLCYQLAAAYLSDIPHDREVLGIVGQVPIPLFIPLNAYATYLNAVPAATAPDGGGLLRFARTYIDQRHGYLGLPTDFFEQLLLGGRQLALLLDGLDEISSPDVRLIVSRSIADLSHAPGPLNIVVTSRPATHRGASALPPSFRRFRLEPLGPHKIDCVLARMTDALTTDATSRDAHLLTLRESVREIEARSEPSRSRRHSLLSSPLMARVLFTLSLRGEAVAGRRTEFLSEYIDSVLESNYHPDVGVALRLTGSMDFVHLQRRALSRVAFDTHRAANRRVRPSDVAAAVRSELSASAPDVDSARLTQQMAAAMTQRGGLLSLADGPGSFAHLAFQELLAGDYLAATLWPSDRFAAFLTEDFVKAPAWWRDALAHSAALVFIDDAEEGSRFARSLLDHTAPSPSWSSEASATRLEVLAEACIERPFGRKLGGKVADELVVSLFGSEPLCESDYEQAARLGRLLGLLSDPRVGVTSDVPSLQDVPAGSFLMGHEPNPSLVDLPSLQSGIYSITLPAFRIATYPITNAQYAAFVTAGGYEERSRHYWTVAGWEWRTRGAIRRPAFWDHANWNIPNHPVVGVSWFEAIAYCEWLSHHTGARFRLPTEAQWERAAHGPARVGWPWGTRFDSRRANTVEAQLGGTTAVGIFQRGVSMMGIHDCAGNVWEWCQSQFRTYAAYSADDRELLLGTAPRCIRGGSWLNNADRARVANRDHYNPADRHTDLGFRIVEEANA